MLERVIIQRLKAELAEIVRDPGPLLRHFTNQHHLSQAEAESIIALLLQTDPKLPGGLPDVFAAYPQYESRFPCWAVVLSGDPESQQFIGDAGGIVGELEEGGLDSNNPDAGAEEIASIYDPSYMVLTITRHADVTVYYYYICRWILTRMRPYLKSIGVSNVSFSGADLMPDPRYIPPGFIARHITVNCRTPEIVVGTKERRAYTVDGIHVGSDGSPSDVGNVETLITIEIPEEDDLEGLVLGE